MGNSMMHRNLQEYFSIKLKMNLNKVQNLKILTKNVWKDKKCTKFSVLHVIPSQKEKKFSLT